MSTESASRRYSIIQFDKSLRTQAPVRPLELGSRDFSCSEYVPQDVNDCFGHGRKEERQEGR